MERQTEREEEEFWASGCCQLLHDPSGQWYGFIQLPRPQDKDVSPAGDKPWLCSLNLFLDSAE